MALEGLEDSRRHQDEVGAWRLPGGASWPGPTCHWPLLHMAVLHRHKDHISTIIQCRFDPRATVHPIKLYNQTQILLGVSIQSLLKPKFQLEILISLELHQF
jgi:hypothetical protein